MGWDGMGKSETKETKKNDIRVNRAGLTCYRVGWND